LWKKKPRGGAIKFEKITYKETEEKYNLEDLAKDIYNDVLKIIRENTIKEVYIDYTGGLRDINYLIITIVRFLKFINVDCKEIIYSKQANKGVGKGRLYKLSYVQNIDDIVSAMSEFINTGNAYELSRVYKDSNDKNINKAIEDMLVFSKSLSICKVNKIEDQIKNIVDDLKKVEEAGSDGISSEMFRSMANVFKEKIMGNEEKVSYINMIEWCQNNNMLQQALTLAYEKMPKYYLKEFKNLFGEFGVREEDQENNKSSLQNSPYRSGFDNAYNYVLSLKYKETIEEIKKFFNEISKEVLPLFEKSDNKAKEKIGEIINKNKNKVKSNDAKLFIDREQKRYEDGKYFNKTHKQKETIINLCSDKIVNEITYLFNCLLKNDDVELENSDFVNDFTINKEISALRYLQGKNSYITNALACDLILKEMRIHTNHALEESDSKETKDKIFKYIFENMNYFDDFKFDETTSICEQVYDYESINRMLNKTVETAKGIEKKYGKS